MIAFSSSGERPGCSSTSMPRWRKMAAARGSILSAMRTLTGSATGRLPRPVEPRPEHLDVGGIDRRPAPDSKARRRVAVGSDVVGRVLALEQLADGLLPGAIGLFVGAIGELQADRGVRSDRRIAGEMLDPVRALNPLIERSGVGVGAGGQRVQAADAFSPVE